MRFKEMIKKVMLCMIALTLVLTISGCGSEKANNTEEDNKIKIVATNFPCYDFMRAITTGSDNVELKMLLKPGTESHSYDPTPMDMIEVQNCDMFVYVGGESDAWVEKILTSFDSSNINVVKMSEFASLTPEETKEGMQVDHDHDHDHEESEEHDEDEHEDDQVEIEYDEHVWTSPINSIEIIKGFLDAICVVDPENSELYKTNAESYIAEIQKLDEAFKEVVANSQRKELIFADRFPIIYFTKEYGLDYYAAFPGCSSETEVSAQTLSFLIDKIKEDGIKCVFYIELSTEKVAATLQEQTGVKPLLFNTAHNLTREEFEAGATYVSLMTGNIERLREALN